VQLPPSTSENVLSDSMLVSVPKNLDSLSDHKHTDGDLPQHSDDEVSARRGFE
jgi:hypothetical protein